MATRIAVLNKGVLQQMDTPQQLYDFPAKPVRCRFHWFTGHELLRRQTCQGR